MMIIWNIEILEYSNFWILGYLVITHMLKVLGLLLLNSRNTLYIINVIFIEYLRSEYKMTKIRVESLNVPIIRINDKTRFLLFLR